MDALKFVAAFREMQAAAHQNSVDHGWWEGDLDLVQGTREHTNLVATKLMLTVSELSEALEHLRDGKLDLFHKGEKPDGFGVELADAVIRCMDLCGFLDIDLATLIALKHEYNKSRPYRHGGRSA